MSNEQDKLLHSERLHQKENRIKKQLQLAKNYGYHKLGNAMHNWRYLTQPHRNHKKNIFNCGDPKCYMCMNPRKANGEKTMQERKHEQARYYKDSNENEG